jgi:hypothetical protein
MINFRYHIVSLVAVLFALSIGVLLGVSSGIPDATIRGFENRLGNLSERAESQRNRIEELEGRLDNFEQFSERSRDLLINAALETRPVVVLSFESTEGGLLDSVHAALQKAGAGIDSSINLSDAVDLATDTTRRQVALALGVPNGTPPAELHAELVRAIVEALSGTKPGFIARLIELEVAESREVPGVVVKPASTLSPKGTLVVIVAANRDERLEIEQEFARPLADALVGAAVTVAAGESGAENLELVRVIREGGNTNVVTVDSLDRPAGQAALVLGLRAALSGTFGHYGFGEGASSLPESTESP